MSAMPAVTLNLDGKDYVVLPKNEYYRLLGKAPPDAVDALAFARAAIARDLKAARKQAGLTQAELAAALAVGQPMVSGAEGGRIDVGEAYIKRVLKACRLPKDWKAPE